MQNLSNQRTNNLFGERNHFAELIDRVAAPVRQYHKTQAKKIYKPDYARFKMKCYYRDQNKQPMFSYDTYKRSVDGKKFTVTDEREGLVKLCKEARKQQRNDTIISIVIWCTLSAEKSTAENSYSIEVAAFVRNKEDWFNPTLEFNNGLLVVSKIQPIKR